MAADESPFDGVRTLGRRQLRSVYQQNNPAEGRRIANKIIASFSTNPIPEIARLGRTLKQWRQAFLA